MPKISTGDPLSVSMDGGGARLLRADAGLFAVSCAILTLEILQIKIFGFSLDPLRIYLAIGVCLLGLGASATLLALAPPFSTSRARELGAVCAVAGAASLPIVHVFFSRLSESFAFGGMAALVLLAALAVPYLLLGATVALSLVSRAAGIGRAYAVNLAGSASGCAIVFPLLEALGAERALVAAAALALTGGLLLATPSSVAQRALVGLVGLGLSVVFWIGAPVFEFPPDATGQLFHVLKRADEIEREHPTEEVLAVPVWRRWDRTGRIDIYRIETTIPELQSRVGGPLETLFYVQDASAGSYLIGVGDDLERGRELFEGTVYGLGYELGRRDDVLVIGLGGAPDVLTALHHGADRITGVEINAAAIDLVRGEFAAFLGHPYANPAVRLQRMDGRTFLRSTDEKFDLIQMSGVDTKTALSSGSIAVNENYLYTREAMLDMLDRLEPEGVVVITRFGNFDAHRLASIAVVALRDLGAAHPERHIAVVEQGFLRGMVVKRSPLTPHEVEGLHAWLDSRGGEPPDIVIPALDWIGVSMRHPMRVLYTPPPRAVAETPFFKALEAGNVEAFVAHARRDLRAPPDDRPFFFLRDRKEQALTAPSPALRSLYVTFAQLSAVSVLFILLPLLVLRRRGLQGPLAGRSLVYFGCLGAGFMLIEIGLIHRFVLLLGHSSYAVTVVLLGLLVGASAGSLFSRRLSIDTARDLRGALLALLALLMLVAFSLGSVFEAAAGLAFEARLLISLAILTALGFLLGIPFPTALRSLDSTSRPLVAWCIGLNGFASVLGSTAAIPIAMIVGLRILLLLGVALYALALVAAPLGRDRASTATAAGGR